MHHTKHSMLFALIAILVMTGCESGSATDTGGDSTESRLPKLDFHKPETLVAAAQRLRTIHDVTVSDAEMPKPTLFKIQEVIHGTGAGAHSHFYLAFSDEPHDDHHAHEDMESAEKFHDIEIDAFTEFNDIVGWLPRIAANTDDVGQETFNGVKKVSDELNKATNSIFKAPIEMESARKAYRAAADSIEKLITELESFVGKDTSDGSGERP